MGVKKSLKKGGLSQEQRSNSRRRSGEGKDNLFPLLVMLSDIDSGQCERLAKAHSFLENEVTR